MCSRDRQVASLGTCTATRLAHVHWGHHHHPPHGNLKRGQKNDLFNEKNYYARAYGPIWQRASSLANFFARAWLHASSLAN